MLKKNFFIPLGVMALFVTFVAFVSTTVLLTTVAMAATELLLQYNNVPKSTCIALSLIVGGLVLACL